MRRLLLVAAMVAGIGCDRAPGRHTPTATAERAVDAPSTASVGRAIPHHPDPVPMPGDVVLWHGAPHGGPWVGGIARRRGRAPIAMDVDGDGVDEGIGLIGGPDRADALFPAVIDARTVEPLWVGPAVTGRSKGRDDVIDRGVFMQARSGIVVVTTNDGRVLAYEAGSGTRKAEHQLQARAKNLCVITETVFRVVQENDLAFDFDAATLALSEVSKGCPGVSFAERDAADRWIYGHSEGLEFHAKLADGHVTKDVDKRRRQVRVWHAPERRGVPTWTTILGDEKPVALPGADDFFAVDGQDVFAEYERGKVTDPLEWPKATNERHVVRLDLATGAIGWSTKVPRDAGASSGWTVTKTHLWISRYTQLDVFERATGRHTGYVGWR